MPKKPTLSPSKFATYLACPLKFKWTYLDPRGKWYLRAKSYYSFGLTLHKVLERFHDSNDAGVQTVEQAVAALEESWIDAGYSNAEEMAEAQGDGKAIIQSYVAERVSKPVTAQTLYLEKMLRMDFGDFVLVGRLDRVDKHEDGTLEIIDYKSGRESVSEEDVATDLAMCCYQLLLKHAFPDSNVCATIVALRTGNQATASLSTDQLQEFRVDIGILGREILNKAFSELEPTAKPLCLECDFQPLCSAYPEFDLTPFSDAVAIVQE